MRRKARIVNLIQRFISDVTSSIQTKKIKKGTALIDIGSIEKHIYFIQAGAVRAYFLEDGVELTVRLGYQGNIITSLHSFLADSPSEIAIETIRASEIILIPKTEFIQYVKSSSENQLQYIQLLEGLIVQQLEREIDILISSPSERLGRVLQRSPNVFQHIPLKYIAAYLRMAPETLSRIRKS
jgi:CRP-like cAMP-binding protein